MGRRSSTGTRDLRRNTLGRYTHGSVVGVGDRHSIGPRKSRSLLFHWRDLDLPPSVRSDLGNFLEQSQCLPIWLSRPKFFQLRGLVFRIKFWKQAPKMIIDSKLHFEDTQNVTLREWNSESERVPRWRSRMGTTPSDFKFAFFLTRYNMKSCVLGFEALPPHWNFLYALFTKIVYR